jgi:cobalt/nickel transport system permease protein
MHIAEGVLSGTPHGQAVLLAGAAAAAAGTAIGLWKMDYHRMPQVAVLSSAFFVASSIQVPIGASSVHLMLTGLMGLVLGWAAFPAVLVALVLQAVFFSIGGPTTLGLNTFVMATPAVVCHYMFRGMIGGRRPSAVFAAGAAAGATAIVLGAALNAGALILAGQQFALLGLGLLAAHLPVALIEGLVTGNVVVLLRKVRPEVLSSLLLAPVRQEALDA